MIFLDIGPKLQYNLLCDGLPEDKQLREQLQMNKLVSRDYAQKNLAFYIYIICTVKIDIMITLGWQIFSLITCTAQV